MLDAAIVTVYFPPFWSWTSPPTHQAQSRRRALSCSLSGRPMSALYQPTQGHAQLSVARSVGLHQVNYPLQYHTKPTAATKIVNKSHLHDHIGLCCTIFVNNTKNSNIHFLYLGIGFGSPGLYPHTLSKYTHHRRVCPWHLSYLYNLMDNKAFWIFNYWQNSS